MSSTKFRKDKEIIADYEIQVKGAVVWMSVSVLCALSLQSLTDRLCQARRCIAFLLCTIVQNYIVINREYSPPWFCLNNDHHMSCKHPAGICSLTCEAWFIPWNRFSRYFNSSQGDFCDPGSALCCWVKWSPCCKTIAGWIDCLSLSGDRIWLCWEAGPIFENMMNAKSGHQSACSFHIHTHSGSSDV